MQSRYQQWKTVGVVLSLAAVSLSTSCTKLDPNPGSVPGVASSGVPADAVVNPGNADAAFNAFNNAFLVRSGGRTYYKSSLVNSTNDNTWNGSLDILVAEDAYERTGNAAQKTLVNDLCISWLLATPTPWTWDGWNDDLGWFSTALIRGYQITGNPDFLTKAKYGFDTAFSRGWDTQYNGGGIWEQQPEKTPAGQPIDKRALANTILGRVACLLYQSTHDKTYLDRAIQIYQWTRLNLYEAGTGRVYTSIDRNNNKGTDAAVYTQGTFVDYANLLYQLTGNVAYYNDAKLSVDYVKNNMTTGGLITTDRLDYNTWADDFARGLGHFVRDNRQWDTYYPWMVQNATALWDNRRPDYNITWNAWAKPTAQVDTFKTNVYASAAAWLQYTPATQPNAIAGVHFIVSKQSGMALDNGSRTGNGTGLVQSALKKGPNQQWNFTQNEDGSWNILNQASWQALDVPAGNVTNGTQVGQYPRNRNPNQRWLLDQQPDGSYRILSQLPGGGALDNSSSSVDGFKVVEWGWNGGAQQRWVLH